MTAVLQEISTLLAEGITVVTPIRRLSRFILQQHAGARLAAGQQAWDTPDCIPWNAWLIRTWQELAERSDRDTVLLNPVQQHRLWQSVIQASPGAGQILQLSGTARQASHSRSRCLEWRIPVFPDDCFINEDTYAFRVWNDLYTQRCDQNGWLDEAMLAGELLQHVSQIPAQSLALYGFDKLSPLQEELLAVLESGAGFNITTISLPPRNESVVCKVSPDVAGEIRAAATWARQKVIAGERHIGVVVHDLGRLQTRIRTIFEDVLCPGNSLVDRQTEPPFNISLGLPLGDYPVIHAALSVLTLGKSSFQFEDISGLFQTPFIRSADSERQHRASLEKTIRRYGEYHLNRSSLLQIAMNHVPLEQRPADFLAGIESFAALADTLHQDRPASAWVRTFHAILSAFGWPGERPLDSHEYQTCQEWRGVMEQIAALDRVAGDIPYTEALSVLHHILGQSGFQPETAEAPIQIMGMGAAAGMQFDHLWITGLSEDVWPPPAAPDPFIPVTLQRDYRLPEANPEIGLAHASRMLEGLIASSPEVVLSYPQYDNEQPLRPSPVIRRHSVSLPLADRLPDYAGMIFTSQSLETLTDYRAPAIASGAKHHGGTSLFRDQAACPFRSFARHRLFAEGLQNRDIGLEAPDRGMIVHLLLELFWNKVKSQEALGKMSDRQLDSVINEVVGTAVGQCRRRYPVTMGTRFAMLESERLEAVLRELLALEMQRQPFRVRSCEETEAFTFSGISLNLRTDRIDELMDGRQVIIDYKTGNSPPTVASWMSDRPDEPQLPLYAIHNGDKTAAVVFAWLKRGKTTIRGLAADYNLLPDVKQVAETRGVKEIAVDWSDLLRQWHGVLSQLAQDFRQGHALVDPKSSTCCRQCDLHALCRIHEQQAREGEPDD